MKEIIKRPFAENGSKSSKGEGEVDLVDWLPDEAPGHDGGFQRVEPLVIPREGLHVVVGVVVQKKEVIRRLLPPLPVTVANLAQPRVRPRHGAQPAHGVRLLFQPRHPGVHSPQEEHFATDSFRAPPAKIRDFPNVIHRQILVTFGVVVVRLRRVEEIADGSVGPERPLLGMQKLRPADGRHAQDVHGKGSRRRGLRGRRRKIIAIAPSRRPGARNTSGQIRRFPYEEACVNRRQDVLDPLRALETASRRRYFFLFGYGG
mmetsp:Transcript_51564/g.109671  ORF Transcript_51564/g.109671 Transcript_51564/m.109671 type:complete len:260 (+) Transcript_51564:198-977(+)